MCNSVTLAFQYSFAELLVRWLLNILTIVMGYAHANETVAITVFEDHERYVLASDSFGLSWRLFELGAKNQGIELVHIESSWKSSLNRLHAKRVDTVFAALKTDERKQWASFSLPLTNEGSGIITRHDNPVSRFKDIDLRNSMIGVSENSVQERLAREMGFEKIYSTVQRPQLYEMLRKERLDHLFFGKSVVGYYCVYFDPSRSRNCMKQVGDLYFKNNVYAIALQDNQQATRRLERINRRIINISQSSQAKQLFIDYQKPDDAFPLLIEQMKRATQSNPQ